ncbi:dCTP deaminase [Candidatus Kaiserbacteria bacterium]|nr:dCTP deaminase [Candidatus Kaiserbacteria bacterium]
MILSDRDITRSVKNGDITIRPFEKRRVQPASYDILLGNRFVVNNTNITHMIDPTRKKYAQTHEIIVKDGKEFVLHPGVSVLGISKDFLGSDKYLIQLGGKSSLARIGLLVHNTAGLVNPGHYLNVTLELCNLNNVPIILRPGMEIAQVTFSMMSTPPQQSYNEVGRYSEDNWSNHFVSKRKKHTGGKSRKKK